MKYLKGLKQNVVLAKYTAYKIGGPADYFFIAKNIDDLKKALQFSDDNNLLIFILGGGNNLLVSDEGFRGLVVKIEIGDIKNNKNKTEAGAGVLMSDLVGKSVNLGLKGLEWAGGLPGTLGGALRGNAGCFGGEIKDIVENVTAMTRNFEIKNYSNTDCQFDYRDSIFKHNGEIILSAVLNFKPGDSEELKKEVFEHIKYRALKHRLPSCGSVFKNIPLETISKNVAERFKGKVKTDPFPVLPAAVLIGAAGLADKTIGGAKITEEHANIIVNSGSAKAIDVFSLINLAKENALSKFGVKLEEEVQLIGF